mgnify:FL=1
MEVNNSSQWEVLSEVVTPEGTHVRTSAMFAGTGSLVHVVSLYADGYSAENVQFVPGAEISYIEEEDDNGILVVVGRELVAIGEDYEDN